MTTPARDGCLLSTPLSFYDGFHTVSGVPAFLLSPETLPQSNDMAKERENDSESFLTQPLLVTCCAFDAKSHRLASGHNDGSVYVWDVDHGVLLKHSKELHADPISAISFRGESADMVLTADRGGRCTEWNLSTGSDDRVLRMECGSLWYAGLDETSGVTIDPQAPRFFAQGSLVVFPAMAETARLGSGPYMVHTPNPKIRFSVVETAMLPQLVRKAKLTVEVDPDDVVTRMEVSPDGKGLLAGFTNSTVEEGYTILWPDFTLDPEFKVHLQNGTLGSWAPDSRRVVTWTVPEEPFPQDNEGCCAFLWNVASGRERLINPKEVFEEDEKPLKPVVLRNPFGKNVLWCHFVLDEEGRSRLVMCVIRSSARLLFWDVESEILTHVIPTGISTNDVILGSRECWKMCWVDGRFIKGLDPLTVTGDMQWLGAVSGHQNRAVIWDAAQGVEVLNIALPEALSEAVGAAVDLMMSPTPGKFAIIGYTSILVFCPPVASQKTTLPEHQMVELAYADSCNTPDRTTKMAFSADGKVLAVLHVGSPSLHLWELHSDLYLMLTEKTEGEFQVSYGDFLDFALAPDFNFSAVSSGLVVTNTTSREILIWECREEGANIVGIVHSKDRGMSQAIGLTPGNKAIVTCESSGDLAWYPLNDQTNPTSPSNSESIHDLLPLLESTPLDDLTGPRTFRGTPKALGSLKVPFRKFKSDFYGSERPPSGHRFSADSYIRLQAQGSYACRFSADCTLAVLMPDAERAFLWDLDQRMLIRVMEQQNDAELMPVSSIHSDRSLSHASTLPMRFASEPDILSHVDQPPRASRMTSRTEQWLGADRAMVMSEHDDVFLVSGSGSLGQPDGHTNAIANQLFKERENGHCDSLFVVDAKNPEATRKLIGHKLEPRRGMAMSADGRFVACVSKAKTCSKVLVWSCYAIDVLLPSFHALKLRNATEGKKRVMEHLPPLLKSFGVNLINYIHPHGASLLLEAVDAVNDEVLDALLQHAARHTLKVSLESADKNGENAIDIALRKRSPEVASKLMKYLMERVTHESQIARILNKCLVPMSRSYPKIFNKTLHNPKLFCTITELKVPEVLLGPQRFMETTSDELYATEEDASEIWTVRQREAGLEDADPITTRAFSKVLPYPNACKVGRGGLLRPMLVHGASDVCFASFAIKAVVAHKWRKYGQLYLLFEFAHYALLLLCFTIYSFLMAYQDTYNSISNSGNEETRLSTTVVFILCWILTVPKLFKEFVQAGFYWSDYKWKGIYHWLKSAWNWMEMLCYTTIVVVIPLGQYWLLNEGRHTIVLSAVVALESILLWSKMLYFAQPFKSTGPLVIIVSAIAKDILPFLFLAVCIMFGFAVAFLVLYRHVRTPYSDTAPQGEAESDEAVLNAFGNFGRTLFSVVGYMFGDFDSDVLFDAPSEAIAILLFMLYMIIITVILLNMLIAIMGDSFNRIKSCEEMQFIKARALAIDDIESMLFPWEKRKLQERMGTYLHVALPKYRHQKVMNIFRRRRRGSSPKSVKTMIGLLKALIERDSRQKRTGQQEGEASDGEMEGMAALSVASVEGSGGSDSSSSINAEELDELEGLSSLAYDE